VVSFPSAAESDVAPLADKRMALKEAEEIERRPIAWVDAICPYMSEGEIRALGDPEFPGIERLPIRPRVATAPRIARP